MKPVIFISLTSFAESLQHAALLACPTCKNALHDGTALGYAISVLFMMSMPFAIMMFWAITIIRLRAKIAAQALEA